MLVALSWMGVSPNVWSAMGAKRMVCVSGLAVKLAVRVCAWVTVYVFEAAALLPETPIQPEKVNPEAGVAVNASTVPPS